MSSKICVLCEQEKPLSDFWIKKRNTSGYSLKCKLCNPKAHNEEQQKKLEKCRKDWRTRNPRAATIWARNNPQKAKLIRLRCRLKKLYNMTIEDYNNLLECQKYKCKICGGEEPKEKSFIVDHCHHTGTIRGLLCDRCNRVIGQFKDDPKLLNSAIKYLQTSKTQHLANLNRIKTR